MVRKSSKLNNNIPKVNGRPREHDRDKIASDMIEWARKPDSINLCKFCACYDPPIWPTKLTLWAKESDSFRQSYEIAKLFLGYRREEMLNSEALHVKAYDLNAATYDYFLKEEKRANAEFESKLKAQEQNAASESDNQKLDALTNQISEALSLSIERKMEDKRSRADAKS
jgi:hypothetical protein